MYCQHVFEFKDATGVFSVRERGVCGLHYMNTTSDALDPTWVNADYAACEAGFETFWSAIASSLSNDVRLVEHRWYPFGPGVLPPTPPSRVQPVATPIAGTGVSGYVHQAGSTVTLRTALRKHWGRFYLPSCGQGATTGGQLGATQVNAYANAARTLMSAGNTQGIVPVIYDRVRKTMFGITAVEVDSVPDIQRRRRPRVATTKVIYTTA
jgi:hypothetical protein